MTHWQIVEQLYASEINAGLQTDWDSGVTAWIGGPAGTPGKVVLTRRTFGPEEFQDIAAWLDDEARRLFPQSKYARTVRAVEQ